MTAGDRASTSFRISTGGLPPPVGLQTLQDLFSRMIRLDFEATPDQRMDVDLTVNGLPGLRRADMVSSVTASLMRRPDMLSDGEDEVCLIVKTGGQLSIAQRRRESVARKGDGVLLVYREPAALHFVDMAYSAVRVPYAALAPLIGNIAASAGQCVRRETPALRLLRAYLDSLPARIADPQLGGLVTTHVYDLVALAIGATGEGRELAAQRGLKAARLEAIKADLAGDTALTLDQIAGRQGVSPRYVQMLFEEQGTTFTAFVLGRRLESARAMLVSPRFARWPVTEIALEAGFSDLSYFNRSFKRRYGMTPSDMRGQPARRL